MMLQKGNLHRGTFNHRDTEKAQRKNFVSQMLADYADDADSLMP